MGRSVPFDPDVCCGICGKPGAWDFMGDVICPECYADVTEEPTDDDDLTNDDGFYDDLDVDV